MQPVLALFFSMWYKDISNETVFVPENFFQKQGGFGVRKHNNNKDQLNCIYYYFVWEIKCTHLEMIWKEELRKKIFPKQSTAALRIQKLQEADKNPD